MIIWNSYKIQSYPWEHGNGLVILPNLWYFLTPYFRSAKQPSGTIIHDSSKFDMILYKQECLDYIERVKVFKENGPRLWSLLWRLCTIPLKSASIQERDEFHSLKEDPPWMLSTIREIVHKKDIQVPKELMLDNTMEELMAYRQSEPKTVANYVKTWCSLFKAFEVSGGTYSFWAWVELEELLVAQATVVVENQLADFFPFYQPMNANHLIHPHSWYYVVVQY